MTKRFQFILFIFLYLSSLPHSFAGKVYKVKDNMVYIKLTSKEKDNIIEGDKIYLLNEDKKKKGIAIIKKIKGKKAKAEITKGKAEKGFYAKVKSPEGMKKLEYNDSNDSSSSETSDGATSSGSGSGGMKLTLLGGYGIAGQDILQTTGTVAATKGSSMSFRGLIDYPMLSSLSIMAGLGFEKFSVNGPAKNITDLTDITGQTDITYISLDFWGRLDLFDIGAKFFVLAGGSLLLPMAKSSNVIAAESIATSGVPIVGAGLRFPMGNMDLFLMGDYYVFSASDTVKSSLMGAKFGLSFGL